MLRRRRRWLSASGWLPWRRGGRGQVLHASELGDLPPSDDELGAVEDCLADFFEASAGCEHMTMETASMNRAVGTALKLIALSEGMTKDTMFARQVKRKFC